MKCPVCKDTTLALSERQGIEIDYCPNCRGIWLDRGELDKLLEKSKSEDRDFVQRNDSPRYDSDRDFKHQKPYKRKKSFLEEIFD